MPSPLGHALGGLAAGWLVAGVGGRRSSASVEAPDRLGPAARPGTVARHLPGTVRALVFAAVGMAADLDLLVGRHSQFSHSIGAALIACGIAALALRGRRDRLALAVGVGAAYASHVLLDWLGQDATPPLGITALWPFSQAYYLSHLDLFWGISREPWRTGALRHDVLSILRELAILAPVAGAAWWVRRPRWPALRGETAGAPQKLRVPSEPRPGGESGVQQ